MCLWNFLYKKSFLFHTCKSSAHCHPPALPRLWVTLSHWHSQTHILVVLPQKDLFPRTISWQAIPYLVSSTSLILKLSLRTHSYPLSHRWSMGQNMPFLLSISIPLSFFHSHSEPTNMWCIYLYIYFHICWLEVDVPSSRNNSVFVLWLTARQVAVR